MATKRTIKRNEESYVISLGEALQEFLEEKEARNLSVKTITNYKESIEMFIKFNDLNEDTDPNEITLSNFYKWMNTMKLEGKSFNSINHYLRDCRAFFYWMMDDNRRYIEKRFKIEMMEGQQETYKMFSDEELELLLAKPPRTAGFVEWRNWAIVNWVLATANRAATIVEVRLGDIDFTHKTIVLRHTKNKKAQTIPLSSSLATILKDYIRTWRNCRGDGFPTDEYDFLFPNVGEEQLTTDALKHSFRKYCISRGVEGTNIHGLRHNFAKLWAANNGSMAKLQRVLGHSSIEMSRRYIQLYGEDLKEDYDRFSPLDSMKRKAKRTQTISKGFLDE